MWNEEGLSEWSDSASFFTGYLDSGDWQAQWIGIGACKPFYARHQFEASASYKVKYAYALVSGLGHFKLYMNGQKVGNHEMDPGWTNYHRSVQYVVFDVTEHMQQGMNTVGISVGNGFYAGDAGGRHFYTMDKGYEPYGNKLMAIGEWHIVYEDGSKQIVCSEPDSWKVHDSATTLANVFGSENFDARVYPEGWYNNSYDDLEWESSQPVTPPAGKLTIQNQPPVTVHKIYDTVSITEPKPQVYVFDLGQNMSAMFEIYVSGPAGTVVTIKPGELMNEDGTVATPHDIVTYSEYTLAGTGEVEVWKPDFSCFGARWVQIEGCVREGADDKKPVIHDVKGHFVTSSAINAGELVTNDCRIDQLARIIIKAIESNLQSVHSDCPTIEKLGWLETSHLMGPSIMYVKQVEELWLKIARDMIEAQTEDGLIPDIAPEYSKFEGGFRDSIAWGSSLLIVSNLLLDTYGNRMAIEEGYPAMKHYVAYLKTKEVQGGLINHGLGDWGNPQAGGHAHYTENVETVFYYDNYRLLAKFAVLLGLEQEAAAYSMEAERIKKVYNEHLLLPAGEDTGVNVYGAQSGGYDPDNQVIQAMPLYYGLVDEENRQSVEQALLRASEGRQIRSGEIGLRFLFNTLAAMGCNDYVYDMMMQPEHPSYIRFVEMGETALPEFWEDHARSRNHDMMGHILEWLYKELLGISSAGEAYKQIKISPYYTSRLKKIRGIHQSVRGPVEVELEHALDKISLAVSIPPNTTAEVRIPLLSAQSPLLESGQPVVYKLLEDEKQLFALVTIGSGGYVFTQE